MNIFERLLITTLMSITPFVAVGGEIGEIQWHGFLTSALMITDGATDSAGEEVHYSGDVSGDGGVKDSRLGLTLTTQVDESWRLAAQMKALGKTDFNMELDWSYASYDVSDDLVLNFGKIKYPIGLINEYIDVGYTYPWIRPPEGFYNQDLVGPNLTRISYNGAGATISSTIEDNVYALDIFTGVVDVEDGHVNKLLGIKVSLNMADKVRFELSGSRGTMEIEEDSIRSGMMDKEDHITYTTGFAYDGDSFMFYTELGEATMGPPGMDTTSGYVMAGYRIGDYTWHGTYEKWEVAGGWGQEVAGIGLRIELSSNTAFKAEIRQITPDKGQKPPMDMMTKQNTGGVGLFEGVPVEETVTIYGMAFELVF